jgi:mannose-6-phosphate isomerase-like protein (cupin superfamily)
MINPGDTLTNPVTGERMTFLKTSAETDGEFVLIELEAEADAAVAAAHIHPAQTETFEVLEGTLAVKLGRKQLEAKAGDILVVEAGVAHKWWNGGGSPVRFRCEVRPAREFESLIETMFTLSADGKTIRRGLTNPLRLAVIARHHIDDVVLPGVPVWLQKAALAVGSPLGRAFGYRPHYGGTPAIA